MVSPGITGITSRAPRLINGQTQKKGQWENIDCRQENNEVEAFPMTPTWLPLPQAVGITHSTSYPRHEEITALTDEIEYEETNSMTATKTHEIQKSITFMTSSM